MLVPKPKPTVAPTAADLATLPKSMSSPDTAVSTTCLLMSSTAVYTPDSTEATTPALVELLSNSLMPCLPACLPASLPAIPMPKVVSPT